VVVEESMTHRANDDRAARRRIAIAIAGAALLHLALFAAARGLEGSVRRAADQESVELQIVGDAKGARESPSPEIAATEPRPRAAPRGARAGGRPGSAVRGERADDGEEKAAIPTMAPPLGDAGVDDTAPPTAPKLALDWSGFERTFGERAARERAAYAEALREKRSKGQGFGRWHRLVLRALGDNRRFPQGAPLTATEARRAVEGYLEILDGRITPAFNAFLYSVGAPNDLLHGKVQRSVLRYNPFYVPPPPGELVDTSSVLAAVARPAKTEFSLDPSGALEEIRLVATSGSSFFDASAVAAICAGAPFPPPPAELLSARKRAFFAWGFVKDWRKNGRGNAQHLVVSSTGDSAAAASEEGPPVPD
jgi:TonB family protein